MSYYAGIGSRQLSKEELQLCYHIGYDLATKGWALKTGAATGADQAFAEGALSGGGHVELCLPWWSYERTWVEKAVEQGAKVCVLDDNDKDAFMSVESFHPAGKNLKPAIKRLHARNYLIVKDTSLVIAFPKGPTMGGTGQGIRIATHLGIPIFRLDQQ